MEAGAATYLWNLVVRSLQHVAVSLGLNLEERHVQDPQTPSHDLLHVRLSEIGWTSPIINLPSSTVDLPASPSSGGAVRRCNSLTESRVSRGARREVI